MSAAAGSTYYMTFRLGDELFAVPVGQVREVLDMTPITKVPTAPAYLQGVVNVRGKAVPVVDLRKRFGVPAKATTVQTRIIVLELVVEGEELVLGGLADSVHEVIEVETRQVEPPPSIGTRWRNDVLKGMARRGDDFVILLDMNRVFSSEDLLSAQAAPTEVASAG